MNSPSTHSLLWRYLAISQYDRPTEAAPQAIRTQIRDYLRRLQRARQTRQWQQKRSQKALITVPRQLLDWAAAAPAWERAGIPNVAEVLHAWYKAPPAEAGLRMVIHVPHSTVRRTVVNWAKDEGWLLIPPPTLAQIMDGGESWLSNLPWRLDQRWVLPNVDQYYVRHYNGLTLLRRLLDRLWEVQPPVLLVCDSWVWRYLGAVINIHTLFPEPTTLAPFTAVSLSRWFRELSEHAFSPSITFRDATNGNEIFLPEEVETQILAPDQKAESDHFDHWERSTYLERLAIYSRGNPGVAWAIWRESLLLDEDDQAVIEAFTTPDVDPNPEGANEEEAEVVDEKAKEAALHDIGITVWVRLWEEVGLPQLPADIGSVETFILHTLLLHHGLPYATLVQLLPFHTAQSADALHQLQTHGIVAQEEDDCWRVTTLAYATVRAFLDREGFMTDAF